MAIRCLNEKDTELVHKRLEGEVAAARAPEGKSSGAGAQARATGL
jgi:uncharacterized protein YdaU (DUF1376 family)